MDHEQLFTVVCVVGTKPPQPLVVNNGITASKAGELMLSLENGSYEPFVGQAVSEIRVREDGSDTYLQPDEFFEHRY